MPFVLVFGQMLLRALRGQPWPFLGTSMSGYYYSDMRDVFIGSLCALAVFLASCVGYDTFDHLAGSFAGLFAVGVAVFPTKDPGDPCVGLGLSRIHFGCATLLFAILAYFCLYLFQKTHLDRPMTHRKRKRNKLYTVCGTIIVACIVLAGLTAWLLRDKPTVWPTHLFWYEAIAVVAFGWAWLTKGGGILRDQGKPTPASVTYDRNAE